MLMGKKMLSAKNTPYSLSALFKYLGKLYVGPKPFILPQITPEPLIFTATIPNLYM